MAFRARLMLFWHWLRQPTEKPPDVERLDKRQDAIEERLRVLSPQAAQRARQVVRHAGSR